MNLLPPSCPLLIRLSRRARNCAIAWGMVVTMGAGVDGAPLNLVPRKAPQAVFGGTAVELELVLRNTSPAAVKAEMRAQIYQASSATVAPVRELAWKTLQVLSGQTVVETSTLLFPVVQAETRYLVRWTDGGNSLIGVTDVHVYPTNLLERLRTITGSSPVGVFDPSNQVRPSLQRAGIPFQDLLQDGDGRFSGRLVIFSSFPATPPNQTSVSREVQGLLKRGKAVVWLQPLSDTRPLRPTFQVVRVGGGVLVAVQQTMVSRFADDPESQMNLLHLAEYALHPARLDLAAFELQTEPIP